MAYITKSEVRNRLALDSFKPSDTVLDDLISKAERELKELLGGSLTRAILTKYERDPVDKIELSNFKEIVSISIDGKTFDEYSDEEILVNPDVEKTLNSEVQGWTAVAGTGDTLSQSDSEFYEYSHSLKIAKGAAVDSYYKSDTYSFTEQTYYKASGRLFVDSNTASYTTIKLEFLDADDSVVKIYTSSAATVEITQPSSASSISCVSDSSSDTTQSITIYGVVDNNRIIETVELNGTSSVSTDNSFLEIISVKKSSETTGTVTLTSNSGAVTNCTLSANELTKDKWVLREIVGAPTEDSYSMRVSFHVSSSASTGSAYGDKFSLRKRQWFPMLDGVHFSEEQSGNFIIEYERAEVSKLVRELIRDLTACFALIYLNGGDSSGMNYEALKSAQFQSFGMRQIYSTIFATLQRNLDIYSSIDAGDSIMGSLN